MRVNLIPSHPNHQLTSSETNQSIPPISSHAPYPYTTIHTTGAADTHMVESRQSSRIRHVVEDKMAVTLKVRYRHFILL